MVARRDADAVDDLAERGGVGGVVHAGGNTITVGSVAPIGAAARGGAQRAQQLRRVRLDRLIRVAPSLLGPRR